MKQNKRTAGFTLVELIVVIAIMGILAGVGTVGYSGYIKMARESADNQILAAVNTAFASACLESNVEVANVSAASISMMNQKVYGVSSVEVGGSADDAVTGKIAASFLRYFDREGENITFRTENVKSLKWNAGTFEIDKENSVAALVVLPNGNFVKIDAEKVQKIQESSYAKMGLEEVTATIKSLNSSSEKLCEAVVAFANTPFIGKDYTSKLTAVLKDYTDEDLGAALKSSDPNVKADAEKKVANGLQMVVAEYVGGATDDQIEELLNISLGTNTYGALESFTGKGGTKTCSALALQYALVTGCAQTEYNDDVEITAGYGSKKQTYTSISDFLASDYAKEDPVAAINKVKSTTAYQSYVKSDQGKKDLNGFTGTMGVVGDNLTSIGYDNYLTNGIKDKNAQAVLDAVVGSGTGSAS